MLWACLLLPSLPLDAFARACAPDIAGQPFVVASSGRHPQGVAANAPARDADIRRGQSIAAALALAPAIMLRERDPAAEAEALAEVATIALAFTPNASLVPTPLAASLLARTGSTMPAPGIAQLPAALAPLPLTLLDLDPGAAAALDAAGISTSGEVLARGLGVTRGSGSV